MKRSGPIKRKLKKCEVCKKNPVLRMGASVCSVACSIEKGKIDRMEAAARPYRPKRKKTSNERSHQLDLTQTVFNAWIRWRDRNLPCISSGVMQAVQWDAGHFIARGASKGGSILRFDEANVHKQRSDDNQYRGGGLIPAYRVNLIERIGIDEVLRLENTSGTKKWDVGELKEIRAEYAKRLRDEQREFGVDL